MRHFHLFFLFIYVIILISCSAEIQSNESEVKQIIIDELQSNFKIPVNLWRAIVSETVPHDDGHGKKTEASSENQIIFVPIKVHLIEKNEGILKSSRFTINFPRGGGRLDMSDWTTGESGTYYIKFEMDEINKPDEMKAFFLSQARKRKIENETLGMGCNKYIELGSAYFSVMKGTGLAVNTTRNRHLTVSGGRWFFMAREGGKTYVSQVTITDSNNKDLFCGDSSWIVN